MAAKMSMLEQMRAHRDQREAPAVASARAMEARWHGEATRQRADAERSRRVLAAMSRVMGTSVAKNLAAIIAHKLQQHLRDLIFKAIRPTRDLYTPVAITIMPAEVVLLDSESLAKYVLDRWLAQMPDHCEIALPLSYVGGPEVVTESAVRLQFTVESITVERTVVVPDGQHIPAIR